SSISDDVLKRLETADLSERKRLYAHQLFRHWVERFDLVRCETFFDCLKDADRQTYLNEIFDSLKSPLPPILALLSGLPSNIQFGVKVAPGYSVRILSTQNDPNPGTLAYNSFSMDMSAGPGNWVQMDNGAPVKSNSIVEGAAGGIEIGVSGFFCDSDDP